ncbi:SECRETED GLYCOPROTEIN EP1 putative-RELATED [Salix purpurea]|uniref:SECRETED GLYCOPROTEIN EP1 putative-RELATED n=1 Tax=Salix purpurea TaxID=77065 RepID=A0A9Q1AGG4_SALPP|nr:SECRETED GLYCOPROTEIN EP1 putative-RELATED [Salix purpurea]
MELSLFSLCFLFSIPFIAHATVPPSSTFKYVNEGDFGEYISEYFPDYRPLSIGTSPFQLIFYNTTPNEYTLALRMGTVRSESTMRWVWEANRGNPVRENATLTFGADGNLVLADADGRVAWQTNTANKAVVGLKLLSNGNLVLHDSKGNFVWQSFDSPTDTLLVGQSLRIGGVTRLVSRASEKRNSDGAYTLVMEPKRLAMYYKSPNSPKPYIYYAFDSIYKDRLQNATLTCTPNSYDDAANDLNLELSNGNQMILARPKYNSTLSFLRIGIDGSLKIYTYNNKVDYQAWEVTYTLFSRDGFPEGECQLPERCGKFGLCEDSQCVGCPLPSGLVGWSKFCEPAKPPACGSKNFYYYKLEGVDHSMSKYASGSGPMKEDDCGKKCSNDCKCLGYFYNKGTSKCWIAYDLQTLTKVANSTHVGYIKAPKL